MATRILYTLIAIGLLAGLGGLTGFALFIDQATIGSNNFTTGSVAISTTPTTALVTFKGMVPGDAVQPSAGVVVSNDGTMELRYSITSTADNGDGLLLNAALDLTIREIDTEPTVACDDFDGAIRYGPADLGSVVGIDVIGDPTPGNQAGDRVLAASTTETLCFRVELPSSATGPSAAATTAIFTFDAEQTLNNP
jgi:hypothetical protein